ncbi:MAG: c-type cytochrome biogenesis protein CcmI [Rhodobacterales bacterium]|nr:c-type cytochrome biogenesis protein CcmI [Rhodobacterales bacterium]NCT12788.1 c-type cytochrome biogenesis protein CcmI [Rhodobacterales bacterium]
MATGCGTAQRECDMACGAGIREWADGRSGLSLARPARYKGAQHRGGAMLFWIITVVMAAFVVAALLGPLLRGGKAGAEDAQAVSIYRDQLAEVERDLARGVLDPQDAARTRTEVARRLLAADRAGARTLGPAPAGLTRVAAVVSALVLGGGSLALYAGLGAPGATDFPRAQRLADGNALRAGRMSQAEAEVAAAQMMAEGAVEVPEEIAAIVANLRAGLETEPDDISGWMILTDFETRTGNLPGAVAAMREVVRLRGDEASVTDLTGLLDRMVFAAGGFVSPEADGVIERILAADPANLAGRYYTGLLYAQTDRPDLALALWRGVIEEGGEGLHARLARGLVGDIAFLAGTDYTPPPLRGPTAEQMQAAAGMEAGDREAMIRGMVGQLNARLAAEGGPAEDWARLISSYGVLGETEAARAIWDEARVVFAGDAGAMSQIAAAAESAGVAD